MELIDFIGRVAEGLPVIDAQDMGGRVSPRTGNPYLPGVKTMTEVVFVKEFSNWWQSTYPHELNAPYGAKVGLEVAYPNISRANCDIIFSTDQMPINDPEWAIEIKHISLAGDNGKNNDFNVPKMLSPYLKDRSLLHDINRLKADPIGRKQAVVGYCFDYSFDSCDEALQRHPDKPDFIENLRKVCRSVDKVDGIYSVIPLVEFANEIYAKDGLVGPLFKVPFQGTWKHPIGGSGWIFGWEVL